jgi:ABC-2 type transport system permease protein
MTSSAIVLAVHSARRMRGVLIAIALVVGGFQFLLTQVATFLLRRGGFGVISSFIPDFMQNFAGPSILAFASFEGVVAFGYFHPVVIATHVGLAIAIATEPAAEVETRFADLTLARSVARHEVITRTVFVLVWAELVMLLIMVLSTWTGLACCTPADTPRPRPETIRSLAILLGAIAFCWGGLALAVGARVRRRATATGGVAVAALAAFLLDYLARVWDPAKPVARFSPFHYFEPMSLLAGGQLQLGNVAVMLAIGAAGIIAAYIMFSRRDL